MSDDTLDAQDLAYEVSVLMEGMLYFAGVKRESLEEACEAYIDCIDDVLENSDACGVDEPIAVIKHLKIERPELFK